MLSEISEPSPVPSDCETAAWNKRTAEEKSFSARASWPAQRMGRIRHFWVAEVADYRVKLLNVLPCRFHISQAELDFAQIIQVVREAFQGTHTPTGLERLEHNTAGAFIETQSGICERQVRLDDGETFGITDLFKSSTSGIQVREQLNQIKIAKGHDVPGAPHAVSVTDLRRPGRGLAAWQAVIPGCARRDKRAHAMPVCARDCSERSPSRLKNCRSLGGNFADLGVLSDSGEGFAQHQHAHPAQVFVFAWQCGAQRGACGFDRGG